MLTFIVLVAVFAPLACLSQVTSDPQGELSMLAEDLVGTPDDDESFESAYEGLVQMISRPINLNQASIETLLSFGVLSVQQAKNIVDYRSKNGAFLSFYELQAVHELPMEVIARLRPFVTINDRDAAIDHTLVKRLIKESNNYFLMRISRAWNEGDDSPSYTGSPEHMLVRFRSQRPGDFSVGFNTEKDAGEPVGWKRNYYGFDRWSFHAQLQNKGIIKNVVIGDFQAQFGQGLAMGGAFGPGKGAETITTMRRVNIGIVPYTSAYESGNMRGLGLSLALPKKIEASILLSSVRRDASIESDRDRTTASAMQRSGLHRTTTEIEGKGRLNEKQWGCVLQRRSGPLELGVMCTQSVFGYPILPNPMPYNQFAFRGTSLLQTGFFFGYTAARISTFGEYVKELGHGEGWVAGALGSVTRRLDIALLIRKYDPDFHPRFSNAISENSSPSNETGVYMGWRYQFNRKVTVTAYLDLFTFPWLRYRAYAPSAGYEWLFRLSYQPTRSMLFFLQAREETKMRNAAVGQATYDQAAGTKNNYWVHAEAGLRDHIRFRTKLQFSRFAENGTVTRGVCLSQDLRVGWKQWEVVARYALFDTDDYDNRLYTYENDVLFAYAMPAYNGTGIRKMLMTRINLTRHITVWARYAETMTTSPEDISPRQASRRYATDREVRFQLRIQF